MQCARSPTTRTTREIVSQHMHEHREHAHTDYRHVYMAKQRPDVVHVVMKEREEGHAEEHEANHLEKK